jgi:DNA-binding transcriptional ArsR family regulator
MVVRQDWAPAQIDLLFHALADATRRDIAMATFESARSVSELARRYPMSFAAVQKHVAVLASAGIVRKQRRGREVLVTGDIDAFRRAFALLAEYEAMWRSRLDRFETVLDEDEGA